MRRDRTRQALALHFTIHRFHRPCARYKSPEGHVLIDGALPESAPLIAENIRTLGYRVEGIRRSCNCKKL